MKGPTRVSLCHYPSSSASQRRPSLWLRQPIEAHERHIMSSRLSKFAADGFGNPVGLAIGKLRNARSISEGCTSAHPCTQRGADPARTCHLSCKVGRRALPVCWNRSALSAEAGPAWLVDRLQFCGRPEVGVL
jgi:hypothetical protein